MSDELYIAGAVVLIGLIAILWGLCGEAKRDQLDRHKRNRQV